MSDTSAGEHGQARSGGLCRSYALIDLAPCRAIVQASLNSSSPPFSLTATIVVCGLEPEGDAQPKGDVTKR